jgi:Tol biopolymer transport system component
MVRWSLNLAVTLLIITALLPAPAIFGRTQTEVELGDSTGPVWSPTGQLIAFVSTKIETEIFAVSPDGSGLRKLANLAASVSGATLAWSPDGRRIVFVAGMIGATQLYIMNSDGGDQRQLTSGKWNLNPSWSPDGRWIAFRSNRNGKDELFVMAQDGSRQASVTAEMPPLSGFSWAPDSRHIVFSTTKSEVLTTPTPVEMGGRVILIIPFAIRKESQIYSVNVDGSSKRALTNTSPSEDYHLAWSPDGNRIAFVSGRNHPFIQIYIMNPDGSGLMQLTSDDANTSPAWSPNGQRIAFLSHRDGMWQVYVMNADGSQQTRLTTAGENWSPTWSPDGRRIAYASHREDSWKIYVINSDGTGDAQLVTGP